jgi:hypothetical protein
MKVKIISSGEFTYWYNDKIGEIIDVHDIPKYLFSYPEWCFIVKNDNESKIISLNDCRALTTKEQNELKENN